MTRFTIASFNLQNLIGPDRDYYRFERYSPADYAWKTDWTAGQLTRMNPDITGFQEVFEPDPLREVIAAADRIGEASNMAILPTDDSRFGRKAIFRKPDYVPYEDAALAFAPNIGDAGPGARQPGVALLSRFGFVEEPQSVQALDPPVEIPFHHLGGGDAGHYRLERLSRPVLRARIPVGGHVITVFNAHLKSRLCEYVRPHGARHSPELDLLHYDAAGRALGTLRAALRRMAEAWVLRRLILQDLEAGHPVVVMGDLNDPGHSITQEIIAGERPAVDYTHHRPPDAETADERYTGAQAAQIAEAVERLRLSSAERLFRRQSLRDSGFTTWFGSGFETIDSILLSRHFHPHRADRIGEMEYFAVYNDHITDTASPGAGESGIVSDHGQVMAHIRLID